jgi:hypothetical protein
LQWLQDPSERNGDNLNNVRHEASRYFRNKKRQCLKDHIKDTAINSKNKNIKELYRGMDEFKRGYQTRNNLVKDENGDLLADSHNILSRWKESVIVPVLKKGDKTDCKNYRGISLLLTSYKILSNILTRLTSHIY